MTTSLAHGFLRRTALMVGLSAFAVSSVVACGGSSDAAQASEEGWTGGGMADTGVIPYPSGDAGFASDGGGGSYGSVGVGGGQDFAAFRKALGEGKIPSPDSLDSTGFFAEHFTSLPKPECGKTFCLHAMASVSNDLVHGGDDWTLLQMGMNSPIDPSTIKKPALDLVVVFDRSGSMGDAGKIEYARTGVKLLIDGLAPEDTFSLVLFDDRIERPFGPAKVTDKAALKALVDAVSARGATDTYAGLEAGYEAALSVGDEQMQRRVIFLTDGLPTAGITDHASISAMSKSFNEKYVGLTTIGLGSDVDAKFLRTLSETGGGNFYYAEKPEAVTEVFTEELAFFVAPIAYDLDLGFEELPTYSVDSIYGTSLWSKTSTGGTVHVPSVFLVSRTSSKPSPSTGGRRGGGAAIMANLKVKGLTPAGLHGMAKIHLRYRTPGSTVYDTQDTTVSWDGTPGKAPEGGYFSDPAIQKNTLMLAFFVAFRDATNLAQKDRAGALKLLTEFQPRIKARLDGVTDEDLLDDLKILGQYVDVLNKATPSP